MADTQLRLRGNDPVSRLFQNLAQQGHFSERTFFTRQGTYVCTPSGEFLASVPPADADSVFEMLQRGLKAWNEKPRKAVQASARQRIAAWEDCYPVDGLVLQLAVRDLECEDDPPDEHPKASSEHPPARSAVVSRLWNFDHVWFSKAEARQWIPNGLDDVGRSHALPDPLVARIVGLHLLDSVSGVLPKRFTDDEIGASWIRTEILSRQGDDIRLRITGATHANARDPKRREAAACIEANLLGFATFDVGLQSFERFDLIALGQGTEFLPDEDHCSGASKKLGFAFTLAPHDLQKTPPFFLHRYAAEWVKAEVPDNSFMPRRSSKPLPHDPRDVSLGDAVDR